MKTKTLTSEQIKQKAKERSRQSVLYGTGFNLNQRDEPPSDEEKLSVVMENGRTPYELVEKMRYQCSIRLESGDWIGPFISRKKAMIQANKYNKLLRQSAPILEER